MITTLLLAWGPTSVAVALLVGRGISKANRREPPTQHDLDLAA